MAYTDGVTVVEAQGSLLRVKRLETTNHAAGRGGLRGKVVEFTSSARRRLLQLFARFDTRRQRVVFVTLTFNSTPTFKESKMALKRFLMTVRRRWQSVSGVWRMELQGRGSIHFHVVFFGLPYWKQADLQKVWERCTGESTSIAHVQLVKGHAMLMRYVSKYVAKREARSYAEGDASLDNDAYQHAHELGDCGNWYGVFNAVWLPYAKRHYTLMADEQMTRYLFWAMKALSRGRCSKSNRAAFLFAEDATDIFKWVLEWADEWGLWLKERVRLYRAFGLDMEMRFFRSPAIVF